MPENNGINKLSEETKRSMSSRIIMGIIMFIVVVPLLIVGDYAFFVLILLLLLASGYEVLNSTKAEFQPNLVSKIIFYISLFLPIISTLIFNNLYLGHPIYDLNSGFSTFFFVFPSIAVIILSNFCILLFNKDSNFNVICYYTLMQLLLGLGFLSLLYLRYYPIFLSLGVNSDYSNFSTTLDIRFGYSIALILFVGFGAIFNDIFAYFVGVLFGKHKMCPNISPKKTLEGFFGGVIFSTCLTFLFAFLMSYYNHPLTDVLTVGNWYYILIVSLFMPIVGTIGDLIFSLIKRRFGIKDFSNVLKSHGGILDRLDSILITAIISSLIIFLIHTL